MGRAVMVGLVIGWLLIAADQDARAQSDQTIYSDALGAGWQDWSWCVRDLNSTDYVHTGNKSAKITYAGAWQGFYLRHTGQDTSGYSDLVFWIHGGTTSGRSITVAAQLNDVAQPGVNLNQFIQWGFVAAATWRKVTIPLSVLNAANKLNFNGFWLQDASGNVQPAFYVDDITLAAVPPPSQIQVTVDANAVRRIVDTRLFGVACAVWDSHFNTPATVSLLAANGTRVSRFPGGSLSDDYHWLTNTTGNNTWQWATSFDAFANVMRGTSADAFITVNYGSGTVQEAADWVRYSNLTKGYGFHYWEVGNEDYGSWENDLHTRPHDPYTYALAFRDYKNAMKAVDSSIKVGAVVITGEDSYVNYTDHPATNTRTGQIHNGWTPVMLATLKTLGIAPDFVIYHRYEQAPGQESDSALLQSAQTWSNDATDLRRQLNDYLGATAAGVELVCTENNSVYSNPGKQTTSLVNGLYYADSFGQFIQTEFTTFVWWILRNAQETGNNNSPSLYGWRSYGDYGMVSDQNDRYPAYFTSKLVSRFAGAGDQVIHATSGYNLLSAYAIKRSDGSLSLLLINKSATSPLNAAVNLTGFAPQSTATVYSYGIPQDEAARTGIGSLDLATTTLSGVATSFFYQLPQYSAVVLSLATVACPSSISPATQFFPYTGGDGQITISGVSSCTWTATTTAAWLSFNSAVNGNGNGLVSYTVRENFTGLPRQAAISVGAQILTVVQESDANASCTYSISPAFTSFPSVGGAGSITLVAGEHCAWKTVSNANWITITSATAGIGSSAINYSVAANTGVGGRKGTISIGGQTFSVKQKGN